MTYTATVIKTFHAPVDVVWKGLTDPDIVRQYFFGTELRSDWKVGSEIRFEGSWEGKPYVDGGTILSIAAPHHLSYSYRSSWSTRPDTPENLQTITYNLRDIGDATELTITQENCASHEEAEHSEKNWNEVLEGMRKIIEQ